MKGKSFDRVHGQLSAFGPGYAAAQLSRRVNDQKYQAQTQQVFIRSIGNRAVQNEVFVALTYFWCIDSNREIWNVKECNALRLCTPRCLRRETERSVQPDGQPCLQKHQRDLVHAFSSLRRQHLLE